MFISLRAEAFLLARAEMNLAAYSLLPALCVTRFTYEKAPLEERISQAQLKLKLNKQKLYFLWDTLDEICTWSIKTLDMT